MCKKAALQRSMKDLSFCKDPYQATTSCKEKGKDRGYVKQEGL